MLLVALFAQARAESSPWYWATTVVTETIWTICSVDEIEMVGFVL